MPGDAGSAVIKIKTSIDWGDLSSLESKINNLENTPHTIKVKVEAADGQKGLSNLIKGLDDAGRKAAKKTSTGIRDIGKNAQATASHVKSAVSNQEKLTSESNAYNRTLAKQQKALIKIEKSLSGMTDAQKGTPESQAAYKSMKQQATNIKSLITQTKNGRLTLDQAQKRLTKYTDAYEAAASTIGVNKEATRNIEKAHEQQLKNQIKADEKYASQWEAWYRNKANSDAKIEADVVKQTAKQRQQKLADQIKAEEEYASNVDAMIKNQIESDAKIDQRVAKQTERQINAKAKAQAEYNQLLSESPENNYKAQQQILSRRAQIANELNNWTAAQRGGTTGDYKALQDAAKALDELEFKRGEGKLSRGEYAESFREISAAALEAETNIQKAGKNQLSFGDKVKSAFSELSRYITPMMALREGVQAVRQMVQASMDIESAMTRIQIVTGSTDTQMSQFFETASNQAQELGKGITDVAGSIEVFSRLGFQLPDATNLSKFANIMSNVGDVSVDEATTGLTSIIKGFDLEASDAEHVSDVLIEVGQKYAISASELMQAFQRGGAALHASGASFEESAALFAATNAALELWRVA